MDRLSAFLIVKTFPRSSIMSTPNAIKSIMMCMPSPGLIKRRKSTKFIITALTVIRFPRFVPISNAISSKIVNRILLLRYASAEFEAGDARIVFSSMSMTTRWMYGIGLMCRLIMKSSGHESRVPHGAFHLDFIPLATRRHIFPEDTSRRHVTGLVPRWHGTDESGQLFLSYFRQLNRHGLFQAKSDAEEFLRYYLSFDWTERGDFEIAEVFIRQTLYKDDEEQG